MISARTDAIISAQTVADPDAARELARRILAERRFQPRRSPQPLRRPITWVGQKINDITDPLVRPLRQHSWLLVLIAVAGLALFVVFTLRVGRGRIQAAVDRRLLHGDTAVDPDELDAAADRAAASGDHELALRLRFKAGLVRLERAGRIGPSSGRTNGDVRRQLESESFTALADRFDEVVYGGDDATAGDDRDARDGWRHVLSGDPA